MAFKIDIEGRNGMHLLPMFSMLGAFYIGLIIVKKKKRGNRLSNAPSQPVSSVLPPNCSTFPVMLNNAQASQKSDECLRLYKRDMANILGCCVGNRLYLL